MLILCLNQFLECFLLIKPTTTKKSLIKYRSAIYYEIKNFQMNNEQNILKKKQIINLLSEFYRTLIISIPSNEQMLANWQIFQQLIEEDPIELTKLYTFISKIQGDQNISPKTKL